MGKMTRKRRLILNVGIGLLKQLITVICGFILPRYMLMYYGSSVNGLVVSIANFLGFIALLDMGVGAVVQANLYKPLADNDRERIGLIVKSSSRFFRRLAYVFIVYIAVLCFVLPGTKADTFDTWYTVSLIIIISVSTLAQYMFGMTYELLLNADQRAYVQMLFQIGSIVLNTFLSVVMIKNGVSVHIVKLTAAAVYVLRPLLQIVYVNTHYDFDHKVKLVGEPIKQKWNGFSQHLAAVICQNIDIVVLTFLSTFENVSVYSVYYNVTFGVEQIILTAATGLESLFGNMIAKGEMALLNRTFSTIEWIIHTSVTMIFTIAAISIVPFVSVYTRGVNDANYIAPVFAILLVAAYGFQCLRVPYFRVIKGAGHFKQTQNGAYISAIINVFLTVLFVFKFGLVGAAIGTLAAMLYHTVYFVWYLKDNILKRNPLFFFKYLLIDLSIAVISFFVSGILVFEGNSYVDWMFYALKISIIVLFISGSINLVLCLSQIKEVYAFILKKK